MVLLMLIVLWMLPILLFIMLLLLPWIQRRRRRRGEANVLLLLLLLLILMMLTLLAVVPRPSVRPRLDLGPVVHEPAKEEPPKQEIGALNHDFDLLNGLGLTDDAMTRITDDAGVLPFLPSFLPSFLLFCRAADEGDDDDSICHYGIVVICIVYSRCDALINVFAANVVI